MRSFPEQIAETAGPLFSAASGDDGGDTASGSERAGRRRYSEVGGRGAWCVGRRVYVCGCGVHGELREAAAGVRHNRERLDYLHDSERAFLVVSRFC